MEQTSLNILLYLSTGKTYLSVKNCVFAIVDLNETYFIAILLKWDQG